MDLDLELVGLDLSALGVARGATSGEASVMDGTEFVRLLASVDVAAVDDYALLEVVAGWERVSSWLKARQLAAVAAFAAFPDGVHSEGVESGAQIPKEGTSAGTGMSVGPGSAVGSVSTVGEAGSGRQTGPAVGVVARAYPDDELAARLDLSRVRAAADVDFAVRLEGLLPLTRAALWSGQIGVGKARIIVDATVGLCDEDARTLDRMMSAHLGKRYRVVRDRARRVALSLDSAGVDRRRRAAKRDRSVSLVAREDGMAGLWALLPAESAVAVDRALSAAARGLKAAGRDGGRTMEQLRADLLVAPFIGALADGVLAPMEPVRLARHRGVAPAVQVGVSVATLTGFSEDPGTLVGYGPITAEHVRELVAAARLSLARWVVTDPVTGQALPTDRPRPSHSKPVGSRSEQPYREQVYAPNVAMAEQVQARDRTCRFPGCGRIAVGCDLDHTVAFPDGPTRDDNLGVLCRRHHRAKHNTAPGVAVAQRPTHDTSPREVHGQPADPRGDGRFSLTQDQPGMFTWRMPTGHIYKVTPDEVEWMTPIRCTTLRPEPSDQQGPRHPLDWEPIDYDSWTWDTENAPAPGAGGLSELIRVGWL